MQLKCLWAVKSLLHKNTETKKNCKGIFSWDSKTLLVHLSAAINVFTLLQNDIFNYVNVNHLCVLI